MTSSSPSLPTLVLTLAGAVIAALGLFAAGDVALVALGLGSVFAAGVLHVTEAAVGRRDRLARRTD